MNLSKRNRNKDRRISQISKKLFVEKIKNKNFFSKIVFWSSFEKGLKKEKLDWLRNKKMDAAEPLEGQSRKKVDNDCDSNIYVRKVCPNYCQLVRSTFIVEKIHFNE